MRVVAGNPGLLGCLAHTGFTAQAVNAAIARAKPARAQQLAGHFNFSAQGPGFIGLNVCRFKWVHFASVYLYQSIVADSTFINVALFKKAQGSQWALELIIAYFFVVFVPLWFYEGL